jgi:hypothetical protein
MKQKSLKQKLSLNKLSLTNFNSGEVKGGKDPIVPYSQNGNYIITCSCPTYVSCPSPTHNCCDGV